MGDPNLVKVSGKEERKKESCHPYLSLVSKALKLRYKFTQERFNFLSITYQH